MDEKDFDMLQSAKHIILSLHTFSSKVLANSIEFDIVYYHFRCTIWHSSIFCLLCKEYVLKCTPNKQNVR